MIAEATVDCYGEYEEFAGMLATLEDRLEFPFAARVLGERVEVIELDETVSSERRGVVAKVRKGGRQHVGALAVWRQWRKAQRRWNGWLRIGIGWGGRPPINGTGY